MTTHDRECQVLKTKFLVVTMVMLGEVLLLAGITPYGVIGYNMTFTEVARYAKIWPGCMSPEAL